jgi:type 1 glutamine amidotransferase
MRSRLLSLAAAVFTMACSNDPAPVCEADGASPEGGGSGSGSHPCVLLFSKTSGFRHDSIPNAIASLMDAGAARRWRVKATEDAAIFQDASLEPFDVIVFLLTSGDVLNEAQQAAFETWLRKGRGWFGVHSASDTEYDWPWYGELVGAYFSAHPAIQPARLRVERPGHLATHALGETWSTTDEWYSFKTNPRNNVHVLLSLDESSYDAGSTAMGDHPIAWYHGHNGGRAFYTALGHTAESWSDPAFLEHVTGAIEWAAGREWDHVVLVEFDGVSPNGVWDPHQPSGTFPFDVTPESLTMHDLAGANQHLTRRAAVLDASRPYVIEGLFRLDGPAGAPDSFCLNLNVAGADGDFASLDTWAMNLDASGGPPNGVMRHMGFVAGRFHEIGVDTAPFAEKGVEYLLRVAVNAGADGTPKPKAVTTTLLENGVVRAHFEVDYTSFPYQPDTGARVRFGVNTHGTDWTLRSLRIHYTD